MSVRRKQYRVEITENGKSNNAQMRAVAVLCQALISAGERDTLNQGQLTKIASTFSSFFPLPQASQFWFNCV